MRAERHDLVPAFVEGVVQAAERNDGSVLRSTEDALEADFEIRARGCVQDLTELLLDLGAVPSNAAFAVISRGGAWA